MDKLVWNVSHVHTITLNKTSVLGLMTTVKHGARQMVNVWLVMTAMAMHGKMEMLLMENVLTTMVHKMTTWHYQTTTLYLKTILYLIIQLLVLLVEVEFSNMMKIVNVILMTKFVLSAIKTMSWTVKEFVNLNKQSLFRIVKLLLMEHVLNVKPVTIWIKVKIVSNSLQTVLP